MNIINKTITLPDGRTIEVETGKLAKQADGSVVVKMGKTMLLATVVSAKTANEGVDFLPMSVDYQEKFASTGKIPGGFLKREGRLGDHEILTSRLVDRVLRPLFPSDYHAETQVMISLISADENDLPDALAGLAASSALSVSDIPFDGPISEVRVARVNGEFVINPTATQLKEADMDIMVGASEENVMMVEGEMSEVSEEDMVEAIKFAHESIKQHCRIQKELTKETGKETKREYSHEEEDDAALEEEIRSQVYDSFYAIVGEGLKKEQRKEKFDEIKEAVREKYLENEDISDALVNKYLAKTEKEAVRNYVLKEKKRLDGRRLDEVRAIWSEIDYLPGAHGSAVFTRGETQSLTSVTLGTKLDEKMIDTAREKSFEKFLLHYNFPAFSTGEARPNRGPGRREIGHGNLAWRALRGMLPVGDENPYTIRVVSDILESNGSSSMATVCAGSMALMDAGIKLKSAVSGIAMGLITDGKDHVVLSDILGDEDHLGDMDFKVTGTEKGITACQMDIKVDGLPYEIMVKALNQAKEGRAHILNEMNKSISQPRADYKDHAPRVKRLEIAKDFIGAVIGPGGKNIQELQAATNTTINIEEVDNKGVVSVFGTEREGVEQAAAKIKAICAVPEVGEVYDAKVKSIMPYGAFVEFMPGHDGLLHISEITWERLDNMEGVLTEGEEIKVKLIGIDKKTGKVKLSRKVLLPKPEEKEA